MTSAFNIVTDVSQHRALNGAVGFSRDDVSRAIVECTGYEVGSDEHAAIMATLTRWGNGYLFANRLAASDGMYQSVMVVQLLNAVKDLPREEVQGFLAGWVPTVPLQEEPESALMDYYAPSAALLPLLQRLTGPGLSIPAPTLNALSVEARVAAASAESADDERAAATIVRTLYYEGLLTHTAAAKSDAGAGTGYADPSLRVPNDNMQRRYFARVSAHLRRDDTIVAAARKFITSGTCAPLETMLASVCRAGLHGPAVRVWTDVHVSQRLAMALMAAHDTGYTWTLEAPVPRVGAERASTGRADVRGVSRNDSRHVLIEVKQVNVAYDLVLFQPDRRLPHDANLVANAEQLATMSAAKLRALALAKSSIKVTAAAAAGLPVPSTAGDIVDGAKAQVGEYAAGWLQQHAGAPGKVLDTYVAVAFGPLRWHIQFVKRHVVPAADGSSVATAAGAGAAAPAAAAAQLK